MGTRGDEVVGMVRDGKVEFPERLMWPAGATVKVVLVEPQPNTPEAIAAWREAFAKLPVPELSPEYRAEMDQKLAEEKARKRAYFAELAAAKAAQSAAQEGAP